MKIVAQQVIKASVYIDNKIYSSINRGMLIFLGIHHNDTVENIEYLINKVRKLRIFKDDKKKMNLSIQDLGLPILLVSQFTLCADVLKGNRPSFIKAAKPDKAKIVYDLFIEKLSYYNIIVKTGKFGANMQIKLINDGPNTFILES
tara:strand:+ start:751 stop:1188 length:438 start_codon:yes stop_codon:yes gene_type:complete